MGCQSSLGTLQWNRKSAAQPVSRSTQNTDAVSSINFSNPGVSYPFTLLFSQLIIHVIESYWKNIVRP